MSELIIEQIEKLSAVYDKPLTDKQSEVWLSQLSDIPPSVLPVVVDEWIATEKWMPRISEIRGLAVKHQREAMASPPDALRVEAVLLEDEFYENGNLDPKAWDALATKFLDFGRTHGAARLKTKFADMVEH